MRRRQVVESNFKPSAPLRAVSYDRVSTTRQATHELSIEQQKITKLNYAADNNMVIVKAFEDLGLTGRTDGRPGILKMVNFATEISNNIQVVLVYSFSRFFRNLADYVHYRRVFADKGIRLLSATQVIANDHNGQLLENMIAAFDDHASAVNAALVKDMMAANAENGFWNGARVPFGYQTIVVCVLNKKEKKKLAIREDEALVVRLIYRWYLEGDGKSGPMGIKAIVTRLNAQGFTLRSGKPFYTSSVELILTSETYVGTAYYNKRDSRTGKERPRSEWISIPTPVLIDQRTYDAVQRTLMSRAPVFTAPRIVNGPTLLTGLALCDCCSVPGTARSGMMLRTGKSGQYRYLVCSNKATKSVLNCDSQALRMEMVDDLVLTQLEAQVFKPDRLRQLLRAMTDRSCEGADNLIAEIERQTTARRKAEQSLRNLYHAIANAPDIYAADDPILQEQCRAFKLQISELNNSVSVLQQRKRIGEADITDEKLQEFSNAIRKRLRDADPSFRRQWVHLFVDEVLIGRNQIVVKGSKDVLFSAARQGNQITAPMVPIFARKWRTQHDSNVRPLPSEGNALSS